MSISSNLGAFIRAGVFAAATSGGWAAATHYGKEWNQVEAHENFSTDNNRAFQFSQTSIRGFGDFMSNPGLDHLTHFIYHLDVAGKMARERLESARVNRPANFPALMLRRIPPTTTPA